MTSSVIVSTARALADITAAGAFGPGSRFVCFEPSGRSRAGSRPDRTASSTVLYGTLTVVDQEMRRRHRLVVKLKRRTAGRRDDDDDDGRFRNETLFYQRVVPFLLDCAMAADDPLDRVPPLCHYFYGRNDRGRHAPRDMIVLEDAAAVQGYRRPDDGRPHLDFDHLVVALRTLAKFHGLSYGAKHADPAGFAGTVAGVGGSYVRLAERFSAALDRTPCEPTTRRFRAEALHDGVTGAMRRAVLPIEPLSVLCHGAYCRDELLFRYDDGGFGGPADAMPLNMASVRYGSPALDLSTLLYAAADRATRDRHWDALLDGYCAALSAAVSDAVGAVPVPDRAGLDAEMCEHAVYGLARASCPASAAAGRSPGSFDDGTGPAVDDRSDVFVDAVRHFLDHVLAAGGDVDCARPPP